MAKIVSNVYGDALFTLALEEYRIEEFEKEAKGLREVLRENPSLTEMMVHPKISRDEKLEMIETVFKGKISREMIGLLRMVVEKNHFQEMGNILSHFIMRSMEYRKVGVAEVSTPMVLSEEKKRLVEEKLLESTDYLSFEISYTIDPTLIGGIVIRIGDRVVDNSVKNKLYRLSGELMQAKVGIS